MLSKREIDEVLNRLEQRYPDAECELVHSSPFELLIATILSAQSTDKRVNIVTGELFKEYNTPEKFLTLSIEELEDKIRTIGFYRNKSKNILNTCRLLVEQFDSKVPDNRVDLEKLPGVGRKTANVVLSNAFNKNAIAVDTHVFRVSNRIGLANADNVLDTERDLMNNIDESKWSRAHHLIIFHGRRTCKARRPLCEECNLTDICEHFRQI
ncbi:MAG: endonuclease III [Andreesenia angusta]|nr:endonuclease III [Andreesenia angusta]